jgi:GT2 family glycosyltransferase
MNTGLAAMVGDVLCFTDDDAEPLPDWLERIGRWYEDPSIVGVGGRDLNLLAPQTLTQSCRVVGRWTWYGRVEGNHHLALEPARPVDVFVLKGVNMSYRASVFAEFRLDERLAPFATSEYEFDAGFFARRNGGRLVYDPQVLVRHYTSPRAEWGREDLVRFYDHSHNLTYVMLKHLPLVRRLIFLLYMFLVGQRASWGLVTILYQVVVRRRLVPWAEIQRSMSGKIDAIRSYLAWRREQRARHPRSAGGRSSID